MKFSFLVKIAVICSTVFTMQIATAKETLTFGIISTESSQNLKEVWVPFLADMSEQLDMEIKPFFATDYAGIIQAMRFDKVDVAWFGNKSAMEAVDRSGGEIFAQTMDVSGNPGYWSLLIAHKDSPINSVEDILNNAKDLTFGNGDPNSTSGYLVPSYYVWAKNNVEPKEIFKRTLNSSHETNALSVANQQVDIATNNTETMARIELNYPEKFNEIKILWKSPLIPSDPIVWRKNLDNQTKDSIYEFFMAYGTTGDEKELQVLADLQWAPFRASSDLQLLPIRQMSLFKDKLKIENNDKLSSAEKEKQLNEINGKLSALNRMMAALSVEK